MNYTNKTAPAPAFRAAAASVPGRDHQRLGRNNQDAFALWQGTSHLCAVVADGCGSAPHSEIGARLGARLLAQALARKLEPPAIAAPLPLGDAPLPSGSAAREPGFPDCVETLLAEAREELLAQLLPIARALAGAEDERVFAAAVRDHLLFTLVGALVGSSGAVLFALGDGALALDGVPISLGPFADNEPPYLGYGLLPERLHGFSADQLRFNIAAVSAAPFEIALGSDGALELFAATPPRDLASETLLFENPDALRRKLWLRTQPRHDGGPTLLDDTTLILLRAPGRAGEA